ALDHPNAETFYDVIERNKVTGVFTSPTAARLLMRYGAAPARKHDLSSLERVFCAGEVLNAPAWEWLQKEALEDKVPVIDHYWQKVPGKNVYFTGDATSIDSDGYVWFSGRADEIIKIADHRIGTIEVETAFLRHPAVTEAGVTGRPDELRGQVISAFVVLKQ